MSDPFSDAEFTGRAGKLLRMLASDHAGEAEAARLKLLQWLDQHGTTINDVADRLGGPAGRSAEPNGGNAREVAMLRAQVREAEIIAAEALRTGERQRLQAAQNMQERKRERLIGSGACVALAGLSLWLLARPAPAPVTVVRVVPAAPAPVASPPPPAASMQRPSFQETAPAMPPQAWERPAYVAMEQAQLRSVPTNGDVVADLERGDRVTVLQGPYSGWVLVRSKQGLGWLRATEIME